METQVDEIATGIYRLSTFVPDIGPDRLHVQPVPDRRRAAAAVPHRAPRDVPAGVARRSRPSLPVERLRWITFGHLEADECGAMNEFLAAAPAPRSRTACSAAWSRSTTSATGRPVPLADGQVLDLGAHRVRHIDTPHVPHGWDARVLYEETTGTLLCGDLFSQVGDGPAVTTDDVLEAARSPRTSSAPPASHRAPGRRSARLAELAPSTLAIMHGSSFAGDGAAALHALAADYDARLDAARDRVIRRLSGCSRRCRRSRRRSRAG